VSPAAVLASPVSYQWLRPSNEDRTHLFVIGPHHLGFSSVCRTVLLTARPEDARPPVAGLRCSSCARFARREGYL
jgi:hypothetical protein